MPTLVVNGEPRSLPAGATVAVLLRDLKLDPREVAVERNRQIVPRARYETDALGDGDTVEVVTFVGGG